MIAAETPRLALATPAAPTSDSLVARLASLLTRAAQTAAANQDADDEAVWASVARGF